jgi:hypothetical protein
VTDDDLERVLRRYRLVGPDDRLRARVLNQPPRRRSTIGWVSAAAGLALACWLHVLASRTHDRVAGMVAAGRLAEEAAVVQMVVADLGDESLAREIARRIVADRERRARAEAAAPAPPVEELWIQ